MTIPTWQRINRDQLLVELRRAVGRPSLLVVRGDDRSGRGVAANLVEEWLSVDYGHDVIRVSERTDRPSDLREAFLDCWEKASSELPVSSIPPWLSARPFIKIPKICERIAETSGEMDRSFIFDTVDPLAPLNKSHFGFFQSLSSITKSPVVVFSRRESRSDVRSVSGHDLGRMTVDDIKAKLYPVRAYLALDAEFLDDLVTTIARHEEAGSIAAQDVYDIVGSALPSGV